MDTNRSGKRVVFLPSIFGVSSGYLRDKRRERKGVVEGRVLVNDFLRKSECFLLGVYFLGEKFAYVLFL